MITFSRCMHSEPFQAQKRPKRDVMADTRIELRVNAKGYRTCPARNEKPVSVNNPIALDLTKPTASRA